MATFQTEYETTTNAIDSIVSTQLSSVLNWINVPGGLVKVVSSSSGFAWGFNGASVYSCQLPCSGKWQPTDLSKYSVNAVLDVASDDTTVYVLYKSISGNTNLLVTPSNRQGVWATIAVPFDAMTIFSTHTYLWAQDAGNRKQMCPKPCTMANWIASSEDTITITSSTNTHLYGKDPSGVAMQTDETLRSGWSPITQFGDTKVNSVIGSDSNVYAIDQSLNTLKFDGTSVSPLATSGYAPLSLTTGNNQLWMTSSTPGNQGNVFSRLEKPDHIAILNTVAPLDKQRDTIVSAVESDFNKATDVMTVNRQSHDIIDFFKKMFNIDGETAKKARSQTGHINEQIRSTQKQIEQISSVEPILQLAIGILLAVALVYILLGSFGLLAHGLAIVIVGTGLFFILKFK